jgi:hypothetical protein
MICLNQSQVSFGIAHADENFKCWMKMIQKKLMMS